MKLSDNVISKVDEASFVGICIDSHLTWRNHIRAVKDVLGGKLVFFLNYDIVFRSIHLSFCINLLSSPILCMGLKCGGVHANLI